MKLGYLVGFLSLAAVCSRPANGSHHGATVTLSAKWASTATIHEAAEYLVRKWLTCIRNTSYDVHSRIDTTGNGDWHAFGKARVGKTARPETRLTR
jgi:hypothetical protein